MIGYVATETSVLSPLWVSVSVNAALASYESIYCLYTFVSWCCMLWLQNSLKFDLISQTRNDTGLHSARWDYMGGRGSCSVDSGHCLTH